MAKVNHEVDGGTLVLGVRVTEEQRAKLDRLRADRGHRSVAETLRQMIEQAPSPRRRTARRA